MARVQRPSHQWNFQHGRKIVHRWWFGAWWHAFRLNRLRSNQHHQPYIARRPYLCKWTNDYHQGHVGAPHWHVGRPPDVPS